MPRLAVVGSRKVTPYGRSVTTDLIQAVARLGVVIISGLALGVDAIAHQAALDAGGRTLAVLPCGLDAPYPVRHRPLARNILTQGGALVSEYSNGTPPLQFRFLERNRLVSGLADALLITEATIKSGTLHTANFALEQGKTVMAIPGNITSQLSQGTNSLIRTGAVPITSAEDILQALNLSSPVLQKEVLPANAAEAAILDLIRTGTSEGSALQTASRLDAALFGQTLTMLEITGKIRPLGAGHWTIN
jgi:DNA processing protein